MRGFVIVGTQSQKIEMNWKCTKGYLKSSRLSICPHGQFLAKEQGMKWLCKTIYFVFYNKNVDVKFSGYETLPD
jgi:hypothetical protein